MPLVDFLDPPSVRAAIDVTYTAVNLPDAIIELPVFVNPAIDTLVEYYADAADVETVDQQRVANALNFLVAANILPSLPILKIQRTSAGSAYERVVKTIDERVAELRWRAWQELAPFQEETQIPTIFDAASGTRGY